MNEVKISIPKGCDVEKVTTKVEDGVDADEIARMREENRLNAWKLQIKRLNTEVRRLKDENFTLIYKLNQEKEKNKK
jgi:muconolactone delta-isomerase